MVSESTPQWKPGIEESQTFTARSIMIPIKQQYRLKKGIHQPSPKALIDPQARMFSVWEAESLTRTDDSETNSITRGTYSKIRHMDET